MFYRDLADIASQLTRDELDLDGILQTFCMRTFADRKFYASFFLQIAQDGSLKLVSFYGANPAEAGIKQEDFTVFTDHPAGESIRGDRVICVDYQTSPKAPVRLSLLAWPVHSGSRTIGSLVTMTDRGCDGSAESMECLESLALLLNSALTRRLDQGPMRHDLVRANSHKSVSAIPDQLTERQEVILRLIAEGRTNGDIAEVLGYSESLIRQETIRIYAFLGCNGRQEAALIYRTKMAHSTNQ